MPALRPNGWSGGGSMNADLPKMLLTRRTRLSENRRTTDGDEGLAGDGPITFLVRSSSHDRTTTLGRRAWRSCALAARAVYQRGKWGEGCRAVSRMSPSPDGANGESHARPCQPRTQREGKTRCHDPYRGGHAPYTFLGGRSARHEWPGRRQTPACVNHRRPRRSPLL